MRPAVRLLIVLAVLTIACADRGPLEEMRSLVPLYEGAAVVDERDMKALGETVIQYEVDASLASEDDIMEFYRDAMKQKGWIFEDIKRWPGNGSVFSMAKEDRGTLTVQTVTRGIKETGKMRVALNLKGT